MSTGKDSKPNLLLLGSSHFSSRHGFQECFLKRVGKTEFDHISITSVSGGKLNDSIICHALRYVESHPPTKQIIIIVMMAGNAIRKWPRSHQMVSTHERMLSFFERKPNVEIILCGVLPTPRIDHYTRVPFLLVNSTFKEMAINRAPRVHYFSTASHFVDSNNIKEHLYKDGLHLTNHGAEILIEELYQFIVKVTLRV